MYDGPKRRRTDNVSEPFTPQTIFEGIVYEKLNNIEKRLDNLPCTETEVRLRKVETDLANVKGKATMFGAIAGGAIAMVKSMLWK